MGKNKPPTDKTGRLTERVKTARGRRTSSTRWLQRQLNDPYVKQAQRDGYRSRAAYKIIEIDDKYQFLKPGKTVLDLGAAPGGWTQIAVTRTKSDDENIRVIAVDILEMEPMVGATIMQLDFMADDAVEKLLEIVPEKLDAVISDMAPNTTGHPQTDHLRIMVILEAAVDFACEVLAKDGVFVAKVFQGGAERELLAKMQKRFAKVKHVKPKSSRQESSENYVVATGFKGTDS